MMSVGRCSSRHATPAARRRSVQRSSARPEPEPPGRVNTGFCHPFACAGAACRWQAQAWSSCSSSHTPARNTLVSCRRRHTPWIGLGLVVGTGGALLNLSLSTAHRGGSPRGWSASLRSGHRQVRRGAGPRSLARVFATAVPGNAECSHGWCGLANCNFTHLPSGGRSRPLVSAFSPDTRYEYAGIASAIAEQI